MHDGQNLFDPATSMAGQPWAVDRFLVALQREGKARRTVVVGIASTSTCSREYTPAAPIKTLAPAARSLATGGGGEILSEEYLRYLVVELKPFIDAKFRTLTGRDDTFVMGSSRGGLICRPVHIACILIMARKILIHCMRYFNGRPIRCLKEGVIDEEPTGCPKYFKGRTTRRHRGVNACIFPCGFSLRPDRLSGAESRIGRAPTFGTSH